MILTPPIVQSVRSNLTVVGGLQYAYGPLLAILRERLRAVSRMLEYCHTCLNGLRLGVEGYKGEKCDGHLNRHVSLCQSYQQNPDIAIRLETRPDKEKDLPRDL